MPNIKFKTGVVANIGTLNEGEPFLAADTGDMWIGISAGNIKVGGGSTNMKLKTVSSKSIGAGMVNKKYCHIDAGDAPAEIIGIEIAGIVGYAWCIDLYVPHAEGITTLQPSDKRDSKAFLDTDTKGGHIQQYGMPYNSFLDFTNDGSGNQIAGPLAITYICANNLVITWET